GPALAEASSPPTSLFLSTPSPLPVARASGWAGGPGHPDSAVSKRREVKGGEAVVGERDAGGKTSVRVPGRLGDSRWFPPRPSWKGFAEPALRKGNFLGAWKNCHPLCALSSSVGERWRR
ncbi:hypothetical protein P7K49_000230, partial [Saguinus oedipus]